MPDTITRRTHQQNVEAGEHADGHIALEVGSAGGHRVHPAELLTQRGHHGAEKEGEERDGDHVDQNQGDGKREVVEEVGPGVVGRQQPLRSRAVGCEGGQEYEKSKPRGRLERGLNDLSEIQDGGMLSRHLGIESN